MCYGSAQRIAILRTSFMKKIQELLEDVAMRNFNH